MIFLNKFNNKKNIRFSSFEKTLQISNIRKFRVIVETGTARGKTKFFQPCRNKNSDKEPISNCEESFY